jgi:hypothetical protein
VIAAGTPGCHAVRQIDHLSSVPLGLWPAVYEWSNLTVHRAAVPTVNSTSG